jgi:hypothetical protein
MEMRPLRSRVLAMVGASLFLVLAACAHEDVKSGYVGPASLSEDQVSQMLQQQGYTGIAGLHKNDRDWVGAAEKDGHQVNFDISPDGTIHTK